MPVYCPYFFRYNSWIPVRSSEETPFVHKVQDLLLSDVEDSITDVVCWCLPVSVDEAAAPAVLAHWHNKTRKTVFYFLKRP